MIGNTFWDDLGIDAYETELDIEFRAQQLLEYWQSKLTDSDRAKLQQYCQSSTNPVEALYSKAILQALGEDIWYIETTKKRWWQIWK